METEVDNMRTEHESGTEWNLRKNFLLAHWGKFSENRLQCLSNCFVNVEMYGCAYPDPLMIELKDLIEEIKDVVDDHRSTLKEHTQVKFVKAKESDDVGSTRQKKIQGMKFVKATSDLGSVDTAESQSLQKQVENIQMTDTAVAAGIQDNQVSQFYTLGSHIRFGGQRFGEPVAQLNAASKHTGMTVGVEFKVRGTTGRHQCEVSADGVFISSAEGVTKAEAKRCAFENALVSLKKPYMHILTLGPSMRELHTSDFPIVDEGDSGSSPSIVATPLSFSPHPKKGFSSRVMSAPSSRPAMGVQRGNSRSSKRKGRNAPASQSIEQFILLEPLRGNYIVNAVSILHESGAFNKMPVNFDFQLVGQGTRCQLWIGGTVVASDFGVEGKTTLKSQVAIAALDTLRDTNWTLLVKQQVDGEDAGITKDEVSAGQSSNQAIPDSNIGNKLLKLMGWAGGGVGKDGTGIAEPVSLEATVNRQGLGLGPDGGFTKNFFPKVKKVLEEYVRSDNAADLAFAPDFSKEERAVIHKHCQKLGLKTRSYNQASQRYMVVSRKRDSVELIRHVASQGGETHKYRLVPPGEYATVREEVLAQLAALKAGAMTS